jgi:hypothetical protein
MRFIETKTKKRRKKMKRTIITLFAAVMIICLSNVATASFVAVYNPSSPTIDGVLGAGEWGASNTVTMDRADGGGQHNSGLYFQHDGTYLFIGVDSQWGSGWDVVWDCDIDGDYSRTLNGSLSEPYVDVNITRQSPTGYPGYLAYRTLPTISGVRVGFGSGAACASSGSSNVFYEFRIPLADLTATDGDSIGIMISHGYDGIAEHLYQLSGSDRNTTGSWATIQLQPVAEPACVYSDDFEDGAIDTGLWVVGGSRGGVGGAGSGGGQWYNQEITGSDGYLQARATTPASGSTFGAQAWTRTVYDFNDGYNWVINFKWEADIASSPPWHADCHMIEITDGRTDWAYGLYVFPETKILPGTYHLYYEVGEEITPQSWSIAINHANATATLYQGPNATGDVHSVTNLATDQEWYVRFVTSVATSAGYPAKDCSINLYSFCATSDTLNLPPIADAGPDQTVYVGDDCMAEVMLDGFGSTDPDGDTLTYEWQWQIDDQVYTATHVNPIVYLPLGEHTLGLIVNDGEVDSDPDYVVVTVEDNTPPDISLTVDPDMLWPPNHKFKEISTFIDVRDNCDSTPCVILYSVASSEPENAHGDGNTYDDIVIEPDTGFEIKLNYDRYGVVTGYSLVNTLVNSEGFCLSGDMSGPYRIFVRSERSGPGPGRKYTITYLASDDYENMAMANAAVVVPHDMGDHDYDNDGASDAEENALRTALNSASSRPYMYTTAVKGWGKSFSTFVNVGSSNASGFVKVYDSHGVEKTSVNFNLAPKAQANTWTLLRDIYKHASPAFVRILSTEPLYVDNGRWSKGAGWGFDVPEITVASGTEFVVPLRGWSNSWVNVSNPFEGDAVCTVRTYSSSGALQSTNVENVPSFGMISTWDILGDIYDKANPAVVKITSDADVLVEHGCWSSGKGWGSNSLPVSTSSGTSFLFPVTGWSNSWMNIANTESSSDIVTVRIFDSNGVQKRSQNMTIAANGFVSTWDWIGDIYNYANPAVVSIESNNNLVVTNGRWSSSSGWEFNVPQKSVCAGKHFIYSIRGWSYSFSAIANASATTANVNIRIYNASGVLKKNASATVPAGGVINSWHVPGLGSLYGPAGPATVEITSDQDIIVDNGRWSRSGRYSGWGFTILPVD